MSYKIETLFYPAAMSEIEPKSGLIPERIIQNPFSYERLITASAQDFQQALSWYSELSSTHAVQNVGRALAHNLWVAGIEITPITERILSSIHREDHHAYHRMAEFFRDIGNFGQMHRMLVASRSESGFYEDFWLTCARKRQEFGENPQPDLDKVRDHIESSHYSSPRYRGYSELAKATYDVTHQPQDELLSLSRDNCMGTIAKGYERDLTFPRMVAHIARDEDQYWQTIFIHHFLGVAAAQAHCGDRQGAMELYDALDPTVIKDNKQLLHEVLFAKTLILLRVTQTAFRDKSYQEGFNYASQWFEGHKQFTGEWFETDRYTIAARIDFGEALYHAGHLSQSEIVLAQVLEGLVEGGLYLRLHLANRYQQALQRVGKQPNLRLYDLALQEIEDTPSDPQMKSFDNPYDLIVDEGQMELRTRVEQYLEVAENYAQIGEFEKAKEAMARVDQFGDADDEIKEDKIKTLSYVASQEKKHGERIAA